MSVERPQSGDDAADGADAVKIPLAGVFAVHEFEDAVGAALHRQVDVVADVGLFGNHVKRVVAHVLGVRGGKADAHAGYGAGHAAQQLRKADDGAVGGFVAVAVDVLAQQGQFLVAAGGQVGGFGQDAVQVA